MTATLSPAQDAPVTLTLSASPAAAVTLGSTTITIAAGSTSGTATVTAVNNQLCGTGTCGVTSPANATVTLTQANTDAWIAKAPSAGVRLTVTDDDELAKPTGVKLSVAGTKVRVDWTAVTGAGGYKVEWSTSSTFATHATGSPATISSGTTTNHSITSGLTSGTPYYFRVIATKSGKEDSVPSDAASVTPTTGDTDYDTDNDGLIEVDSLAKFNAIRWDLDGDGEADKYDSNNDGDYTDTGEYDHTSSYEAVFSGAEDNMGCSESVGAFGSNSTGNPACSGYELADNLDFDTGTAGTRSDDTYYNSGQGWLPIGATAGSLTARAYTGEFDGGTSYKISNLHINRSGSNTVAHAGLFAELGSGAVVKNVRLEDVSVTVATNATATSVAAVQAGGIAGKSAGSITGSYVTGTVKATQSDNTTASPTGTDRNAYAGGLVGHSSSAVASSYAVVTVTAEQKDDTAAKEAQAGGLLGYQQTGDVVASYSFGTATALSESTTGAKAEAGGLIGHLESGSVKASYSHASAAADTSAAATTATLTAGGLVGLLQAGGSVVASYSTGAPTTSGGATPTVQKGGLAGHAATGATVTNAYWDADTSGVADDDDSESPEGKTTSALQTPTSETGIYASWNIDVGGTSAVDDPWDFGTSSQYPAIDYNLTAADQRATLTVTAGHANICESAKGYGSVSNVTYACGSDNRTSTTLTATLGAAQDLPVTLTLAANTAYTLSPTSITIAAGSTTGTATLTAVNNKVGAADKALTVGGTTPQNWVAVTGASVTIKDEDTLAKPTGVKLSVHGTKVQVDWTAVTGATGYTLQWSTSMTFAGSPSSHTITSGSTTTHQVTSGLTSGTTYYFRVIATKPGNDDSAPSDAVSLDAGGTDYDADNDGLIEVDTLAELNAIRWDLDGDGAGDKYDSNNDGDYTDTGEYDHTSSYEAVFSGAEDNMGCSESVGAFGSNSTGNPACSGYELADNLDFDTGTAGTRSDDTYYNSGQGWLPIGATAGSLTARAYTGDFDGGSGSGTSYTISNLHVDRSGSTTVAHGGLFAKLGSGADIENLRLKNVSVTVATDASATSASDVYAGGIAGESAGSITGSYVTGAVKATQSNNTGITTEEDAYAGGVVAKNTGSVTSSYSRADVTAEQKSATASKEAQAGGLVGVQDGSSATVTASFSTGTVVALSESTSGAAADAGGLVGRNHDGKVSHSYSHAHAEAKTGASTSGATLTAGGLVGDLDGGTVEYSFATGTASTSGGTSPTANTGGLAGSSTNTPTVTASYWDTTTSGITATGSGTSKTTPQLQTPTVYGTQSTDIYKDWNVDLDTTQTGTQDPWNLGTASQYPVLKFGLTAADQRAAVTLTLSRTNICETTKGSAAGACGNNNVTSATLTAALSPAQQAPVTVDIAKAASRYTLQHSGTFTFAAGDTSKTMTVTAVNNGTVAADYTATLTPTTSMNWVAMPAAATLTIENDDYNLSAPTYTVGWSSTNPNRLTVTWTRHADATGNKLWHKQSTSNTWTKVPSVTSPYNIDGLTLGEVYDIQMAAIKTGYDDGPWGATTASPGNDYDADSDGLLEVKTLAQLNAIRWDLDGNGTPSSGNDTTYYLAFPSRAANMGCPSTGCDGYELSAALDFDTGTKGDRTDDAYHNGGLGWNPIGGTGGTQYTSSFVGNGFEIDNLFINRTSGTYAGLFGYVRDGTADGDAVVSGVGLPNASITLNPSGNTTADVHVGALAGRSETEISGSYSTGSVSSTVKFTSDKKLHAGGLAGLISGPDVSASYSWADVTADISSSSASGAEVQAGGLVGEADASNAVIRASFAAGEVDATGPSSGSRIVTAGGLVGEIGAGVTVTASYARGDVDATGTAATIRRGALVGNHAGSAVSYSFATGKLTGTASSPADRCGLTGLHNNNTITNSYYNSSTLGLSGCDTSNGTAKITSELRTPIAYGTGSSIYANWNADIDNTTGNDDPWAFGTANQYPALKYGAQMTSRQWPVVALSLSPSTIYESVGGATTTTVSASSTTEWNHDLKVAVPKEATRYTVGDITISAGSQSGSTTLTAVNNTTDAANYTKTMTLAAHPATIGTTTTTDTWVTSGTSHPTLTINDDDELTQVTGVTATQEGTGVKVSWTKVTGATGYDIYWKSGTQSYDSTRKVTVADVATHTIPQSGTRFVPGTTYTLQVRATKSGVDDGPASTAATVAFKAWVVVSATSVDVAEPSSGSTTGTYTVKLSHAPTADVTVTITRKTGTHQSRPAFSPSTLTFSSTTWNTAQTVTLTVTPDSGNTVNESTTLVHTATSTDSNYSGGPTAEVVATATDGNMPPTSADFTVNVSPPTGVNIPFKTVTFADADNNTYKAFVVESLPGQGTLKLRSTRTSFNCKRKPNNPYCWTQQNVTAGQTINVADPTGWTRKLQYYPLHSFTGASFTFKVKDSTDAVSTSADTVTLQLKDTPDKPTGLSATIDDGRATLSWTASSAPAGKPVTKYQVRWVDKSGENRQESAAGTVDGCHRHAHPDDLHLHRPRQRQELRPDGPGGEQRRRRPGRSRNRRRHYARAGRADWPGRVAGDRQGGARLDRPEQHGHHRLRVPAAAAAHPGTGRGEMAGARPQRRLHDHRVGVTASSGPGARPGAHGPTSASRSTTPAARTGPATASRTPAWSTAASTTSRSNTRSPPPPPR